MEEPTLEFLKNEAGEKEGLGDAGIETFRDAPYASCAREAGQNSRDAEEVLPVRMTFNVIRLTHDEFPSHARLLDTLEACAESAEQEKEKEFFSNALTVASRSTIPVLEIADYSTKGLAGPPNLPGTPFHSLLKSMGVSTKDSETSGGSFGIGKNASFAVSDLQMVLYSTRYAEPETGNSVVAAQGKTRLVSHRGGDGQPRRATGYWGFVDGFTAITDEALIPAWMRRGEKGTSIFCMGFRESEDWAEHMTSSLVTNFFAAIHRDEMVFDVADGRFQINRNTLEGLLERSDIKAAAEKSGQLPDLEFATQLQRCLVSPAAAENILAIPGLGRIKVRILVEPKMPRRIGFVRNGMLITDNLRHFGQPLARFPGARDFVALVEPIDQEAGKLLKRLENPAHDNFSAQRISDPAKRAAAEGAMRLLGRKLREAIKATTGVEQQESVVLDELARFFADSGKADSLPDPKAEHDPEKHVFKPPRIKPIRTSVPAGAGGTKGGRGGPGQGAGGNNGGSGPGAGAGAGGTGMKGERETVHLTDVRNRIVANKAGEALSRIIFFSCHSDGTLELTLQATGINAPETLGLTAAEGATLTGNVLRMTAGADKRERVLVTFSEPYDGPLEMYAEHVRQGEQVA